MDDLGRPSPKGMAPRRPSLQPRPQLPARPTPVTGPQSRRFVPVALAWADTGALCSLALRPAKFSRLIDLYAGSLVVTEAVAGELRRLAGGAGQRWTPENPLLRLGASNVVQKLDSCEIRELPLAYSQEAIDELERVLRQLRDFEAAQNARFNRPTGSVASAHKHTGEAHSIVNALRTQARNRKTVLLTNDGGAIAIARQNGIPWKHVGQILIELGCEDSEITPEDLYKDCVSITAKFASLPAAYQPAGPSDFVCTKTSDGSCPQCP